MSRNTSEIDQTDITRDQILILIKSACERYKVPQPTRPAIIDVTSDIIRPLLQTMEEKDFYQWFCPIWQSFEYLYSSDSNESSWIELVGKFAKALTERQSEEEEFNHPSLRAMCVSFMMNSLNNHVVSQSYALRMLLLFATRTELCQDKVFVRWLINFMKQRIDNMMVIDDKEQRKLFASVCVGFFDSIPVFDSHCCSSILKFFGSNEFTQILLNNQDEKPHLQSIASKSFNTALSDDTFFIFEIISNTKLIYTNLNKDQQELLQVFVNGTVKDFDAFVQNHQDYITRDKLNLQVLRHKILVLSFVSIAHGKKTILFSELYEKLGVDTLQLKKLCVSINSTDVAKLSIDSVNEQIIINYCQPREMTPEVWESMAKGLHALAESITQK